MSSDERKIAERMLMNELKELQKENWVDVEVCSGFSLSFTPAVTNVIYFGQPREGNLFLWDVALIVVNPTSLYSGAYLKVPYSITPHVYSLSDILIRWVCLGRTQDPEKLPHEPTRVPLHTSSLPPQHLQGRQAVYFDSPCTWRG